MQQRDENKPELKMIKMSDVQSQTVDWLWYHLSLWKINNYSGRSGKMENYTGIKY